MKKKLSLLSAYVLTLAISCTQAPKISCQTPQTYTIGKTITPLFATNTGTAVAYGMVSSFAGKKSSRDGFGIEASFNNLSGIAVDNQGNVFVADTKNNKIRKISTSGIVTTLAGNGLYGSTDGVGISASFNEPYSVALDALGNLYVADTGNNKIRKINSEGMVTTLAGSGFKGSFDGMGASASFIEPDYIAVDRQGNVYVVDGNTIRKISPLGMISTLAGNASEGSADGVGISATFRFPSGLVVDSQGIVYVADWGNKKIRKISPAGMVTTLAGSGSIGYDDGKGKSASFSELNSIAVNPQGNLYVTDYDNIRKVSPTGKVTTLNSSEEPIKIDASFNKIAVDILGNIYVTNGDDGIDKISPTGEKSTLVAGQKYVTSTDPSVINDPENVTADIQGNVYVADKFNNSIRKISPTGIVTTLAGGKWKSSDPDIKDNIMNGRIPLDGFNQPNGIAVDSHGIVYVADWGNHKIRKISPSGKVTTLAGSGHAGSTDGTGILASFKCPKGIAVDGEGNIYVTEEFSNKIRKISPTGLVTTLAGNDSSGSTDGIGRSTSFNQPSGITVDVQGNVYVADTGNNNIRKISPAGLVTTLAGSDAEGSTDGIGSSGSFRKPSSLTVDVQGNVFVADTGNNKIRKISPTGLVTTLAGNDSYGSADGIGISARFDWPKGITIDLQGNIFVADTNNQKIRKIVTKSYTVSPELPAGLRLDPTTGTISGTPTAVSPKTIYIITHGIEKYAVSITVN